MVSGLNGQSGHSVPSRVVKVPAHRYDIVPNPRQRMEEMIVLGRIFTIQLAGESHTADSVYQTPCTDRTVTHLSLVRLLNAPIVTEFVKWEP